MKSEYQKQKVQQMIAKLTVYRPLESRRPHVLSPVYLLPYSRLLLNLSHAIFANQPSSFPFPPICLPEGTSTNRIVRCSNCSRESLRGAVCYDKTSENTLTSTRSFPAATRTEIVSFPASAGPSPHAISTLHSEERQRERRNRRQSLCRC